MTLDHGNSCRQGCVRVEPHTWYPDTQIAVGNKARKATRRARRKYVAQLTGQGAVDIVESRYCGPSALPLRPAGVPWKRCRSDIGEWHTAIERAQ